MTVIGLLGAGGQAREVTDFAGTEVDFMAVDVDHLPAAGAPDGVRTIRIDAPTDLERDTPVLAAVGPPGLRRTLTTRWKGTKYARALSARAYLAHDVEVGVGSMVAPGAVLMAGVRVGRHVLINATASIGHDTVVEEFVTVSPGASVGGRCVLGRGCFIGIGAAVLQGVRIGEGTVVGAGAVVTTDLDPLGVYVGAPARRLRDLEGWIDDI